MNVLDAQLQPEANMADDDRDDVVRASIAETVDPRFDDNFKSWAAKQSPDTVKRIESQGHIDATLASGKEPSMRDLISAACKPRRRNNPIAAEVIQPVADTTR